MNTMDDGLRGGLRDGLRDGGRTHRTRDVVVQGGDSRKKTDAGFDASEIRSLRRDHQRAQLRERIVAVLEGWEGDGGREGEEEGGRVEGRVNGNPAGSVHPDPSANVGDGMILVHGIVTLDDVHLLTRLIASMAASMDAEGARLPIAAAPTTTTSATSTASTASTAAIASTSAACKEACKEGAALRTILAVNDSQKRNTVQVAASANSVRCLARILRGGLHVELGGAGRALQHAAISTAVNGVCEDGTTALFAAALVCEPSGADSPPAAAAAASGAPRRPHHALPLLLSSGHVTAATLGHTVDLCRAQESGSVHLKRTQATARARTLSSVERSLRGVASCALPLLDATLEAHARGGGRHWCTFCGAVVGVAAADLVLCRRCHQVGYCDEQCRGRDHREGAHIAVCAQLAAEAAWAKGKYQARRQP